MGSRPQVKIIAPRTGLGAACRSVIDALPGWFGIPESNDEFAEFAETHATWSAVDEAGTVVGVLGPRHHVGSAEIHLLAVLPEWQHRGVGRRLLEAFEAASSAAGFRLAHVKTLGPSDADEGYARTRRFYTAMGYTEIEEIVGLWPDNPTAIMVKPLTGRADEAAVIVHGEQPVSTSMILDALRSVGVVDGSVVIVHSSVSRLGWVVGGAQAIVEALLAAVGPTGTIVMPAQTGMSDPADWQNPPVPESWWATIRDTAPAFDPALTPMRGMGQVVECFRRLPGVLHSGHPAAGFVALGPAAASIVEHHPLEQSFGDGSPLGTLYDLGAHVVLIGVGHGNNTSLHLAERRSEFAGKRNARRNAAVSIGGVRRWVAYEDLDDRDDDFVAIGAAYAADGGSERRVQLGAGEIVSCPMREIVDFAVGWMAHHRD